MNMRETSFAVSGYSYSNGTLNYTPSKRLQFCFLLVTRVYLHSVEFIWNGFMRLFQIVISGNEKHGRPAHTIDSWISSSLFESRLWPTAILKGAGPLCKPRAALLFLSFGFLLWCHVLPTLGCCGSIWRNFSAPSIMSKISALYRFKVPVRRTKSTFIFI